jgi:hypothetical protein
VSIRPPWTVDKMRMSYSPLRSMLLIVLANFLVVLAPPGARSQTGAPQFDGFNVIAVPGHPFGSDSAKFALLEAVALGARAIAVIPFVWQSNPSSPDLVRGDDMTDDELRTAIRDAHALGLAVVVKPHVWVPDSWAGAIAMNSEPAWRQWFANYQRQLERIARIADANHADSLAVGTELCGTTQRPEWNELIDAVRGIYHGHMLYVAHNIDEAETVPFWDRLDSIGVTLYPSLGDDGDRDGRRRTMEQVADRLDGLAARTGKSILVGEVGLRSAVGAAAKPWESAEERASAADPRLQAEVLGDWLDVLDRPSIQGVLVWRWLTDPNAGGLSDTDFTVQRKPAESVLMCAWTQVCDLPIARLSSP